MKVNILGLNFVNSIALVIISASPLLGGVMIVFRQIVTLTKKNLRLEVSRHVLSTTFRALLLPVVFVIFLGYAQNLFITPSSYGVGVAKPVLSLLNAMDSPGVPSKLVMVNNDFIGGDIDHVIQAIARPIRDAGKKVVILPEESQLLTTCRETIRQISDCYGAVVFHSSPSEGPDGTWNYTIRVDAGRGGKIDVHSSSNDIQLYPIPLQHAIDWTIASLNASVSQDKLPGTILQYPYTNETESQRREEVRTRFQNTIRSALAAAFFLGQVGVIYHLVGFMCYERERGISQLLEAMMPNQRRWQPQFARLLSYHLSFVIIYLPGWIIIALVLRYVVFVHTNTCILLGFYILSGLALTSSALFGAAFFRRTQLSAITVTGVSLILAILGMVFQGSDNWAVGLLSLLSPPIPIINFMDELTSWETAQRSIDLYQGSPGRKAKFPGLIYWYCLVLQILLFPLLAIFVEKCRYSTSSSHRSVTRIGKTGTSPIRLTSFSKVYQPRWYYRLLPAVFHRSKAPVTAVKGITSNIGRGQITVLLGPNGSGKSTTLKCIAGIEKPTGGSVEIDGAGGLGICPQEVC
jgi:ATP-binding cassette, subfamily A (ABC1), member 3